MNLEKIQPEETMMGNIKGVTLPEIKKLKAMAVRGAEAEQKVKKQQQTIDRLEAENASLQRQLKPSVREANERNAGDERASGAEQGFACMKRNGWNRSLKGSAASLRG